MRKNVISILLMISLTAALLSGCAAKSSESVNRNSLSGNEEYRTDIMKTVSGKEIDLKEADEKGKITIYDESGMGLYYPDSWDDYKFHDVVPVYSVLEPNALIVQYMGEKYIDLEPESLVSKSEEELIDFVQKTFAPLFAVYRTERNTDSIPEEYTADYSSNEKLGVWNGYTYYLLYNTDFDDERLKGKNFTENDVKRLKQISETAADVQKNIIIFEPQETGASIVKNTEAVKALTSFETTDLDGNVIDQEIFKGYDLTMINIWATWCGYCVEEFPEIAKVCAEKPSDVNVITICTDGIEENALAKEILADNGSGFIALQPSEDLQKLLDEINALPTTIFVDRSGKVVGELIEGANDAQTYLDSIEKALKEIE